MKLPTTPRASYNVGKISGGVSINTIAPEAELLLDLRSEYSKQLEKLTTQVGKAIASIRQTGVEFSMEKIGEREAGEIPVDHPLVKLAVEVLEKQGEEVDLNIGSTDANIPLSRGYPAICIGLTDGGGPHTTNEFIFTDPLAKGMESFFMIVQKAFTQLR
jgi:acetylornithine deacetylase/succinyl-diaminopimelate desuccinylase-like protein